MNDRETTQTPKGIKPSLFSLLNPKNLQKEVSRYGYTFSFKKFLALQLFGFLGVIAASLALGLSLPYILAVMAVCALVVPSVVLTRVRHAYEQKRISDIFSYTEQVLYSFKRRSKIITSLEDCLSIFPEGRMHDVLSRAIDHILNSQSGDEVYGEAFAIIEEEFGCSRVSTIHDFLQKVEMFGGQFGPSAEILLEDRRLWMERTYSSLAERKNLLTKITISLVLSFIICGTTVLMLPKEFGVTDSAASQLAATALVISNVAIWVFADKKLSLNLLSENSGYTSEYIMKKFNFFRTFNARAEYRKSAVISVCIGIFGLASATVLKSVPVAVVTAVFASVIALRPGFQRRSARKFCIRQIEKEFPRWLLQMALLLQTDNVPVSLSKTISGAPEFLKDDLLQLLEGIESQPNSIVPYTHFLEEFDLPDIHSAMRLLYSIAEFGSADAKEQIAGLVQRNAVLTDKSERLANEDSIAGVSVFVLIPMVTGSFKMMVDLAVFLVSLFAVTSSL